MKNSAIFAGVGLIILGSVGAAEAQQNAVQGTPNSAFPDAAPNEVEIINGVPCRTALVYGTNSRVVVGCAGPGATGSFGPSTTGSIGPGTTGSIGPGQPASPSARAISGTPGSLFPDAAPNEIYMINGVPCRTMLVYGTNLRVPVACAR